MVDAQISRLQRFLTKPSHEKRLSVLLLLRRLRNSMFPLFPLPIRLPYGGLWLAWNDSCSDGIIFGTFEESEWRFVERF